MINKPNILYINPEGDLVFMNNRQEVKVTGTILAPGNINKNIKNDVIFYNGRLKMYLPAMLSKVSTNE